MLFDPSTDIAILDVPGLTAPALRFVDRPASTGDDAIALGYPEAGPFTASPERVREVVDLSGPDIYRRRARSAARSTPSVGPSDRATRVVR